MNKFVKNAMCLAMAGAMVVPAFATDINVAGGNSSVPVELTAEAATFSVTVPTSLPVTVDAQGVVTTASNVKIVNNSHGAVKVTNMTIAGANAWATIDWDTANMAAEKVGSKKVAMMINNDKTTGPDTISFTASNFQKMDGKNDGTTDELPIVYDAKVPAQSEKQTALQISNVVFTVGWDLNA